MLLSALFMTWSANDSLKRFSSFIDEDLAVERSIISMSRDFKLQVQEWKNVLLRGANQEDLERYWNGFLKLDAKVQADGKALLPSIKNPDVAKKIESFLVEHKKASAGYAKGLDVFKQAKFEVTSGDKAVRGIERLPAKLLKESAEILYVQGVNKYEEHKAKTQGNIIMGLVFMAISVVVAFVVFVVFIQLQILAPANSLVKNMGRMAVGDFSHPIVSKNSDEFGQIRRSSEKVRQSLGEIISTVRESTDMLVAEVGTLGEVVSSTREGVLEQHTQTEHVATAINQMTATVQEVSRSAGSASEAANSADAEAKNGSAVVSRTVENIGMLTQEITKTAETVESLSKDSEQIDTVLDVIRGISEQTNLLALNAAIEAARAGEAGRGFAVVADEVRALASRTQESTQEIQTMIERLQEGSKNAVAAMNRGQEDAQGSAAQAAEARAALETITRAVASINEMNAQIATASGEQSSVAEEINRNIISIATVAENSAQGAQLIEASNLKLTSLAKDLSDHMAHFRLEDNEE